jgi:PAS domain S-box-containing protein
MNAQKPHSNAPLRKDLLERLPAAVYVCEAPSGRITFYNQHAAELWGRAPQLGATDEQFCGSFRLFRIDGSALPHAETPMAQAVLTGRSARNEVVIIERPDGRRLTAVVNIDPLVDEAGRVVGAVNVFHETVTSAFAEEARGRLAAIVEASDDAIVSKDLNGVITSWNLGAERLFGYPASDAIGRSVTMLIPPEHHDEESRILGRIRAGERIASFETRRLRRDGTLVDVSLTISPILDGHGNVVGASKVARDIGDQKRAEQQREELLRLAQRARKDAEWANRAKDNFLAMLGHELRNPLAAVRNAISAATLQEGSSGRALEIAARQTDQLTRIVDDLLDVARITRGHVRLRKGQIALSELLRRTTDGARGSMEDRGHSLTLSLPSEPLAIEGDPVRIEQAIANLLANAAKYTDPGGSVFVTAVREGPEVVIRVRDTGIGISPEALPRIFDLFTQGNRSLDRAQGGLGIGLTLVRRIVTLHGGSVEATSPGNGGGSEFVIRLPALPAHSVESNVVPIELHRAPRAPVRAARVLMVEDNQDAAESLAILLELLGHHVRIVPDGPAALDAARANMPDVMLIDIGLPQMSGYEVAQRIRQIPTLETLVLVAITGYGRPEDKAQAMAAGFDYHLVKPVDFGALERVFARLSHAS